MKFKVIKAKEISFGHERDYKDIKYIVIHYTANKGDTAMDNAKYYARWNNVNAGAHYYVDEGNVIYKSVPLNRIAWSVGGLKWNDCNKTGGGKLFKKVCNRNSLSIEMCNSRTRNKKVEENTLWLVRFLMKKYNIPKENVVRHFDVNGKHCPLTMMDEKSWQEFKSRI